MFRPSWVRLHWHVYLSSRDVVCVPADFLVDYLPLSPLHPLQSETGRLQVKNTIPKFRKFLSLENSLCYGEEPKCFTKVPPPASTSTAEPWGNLSCNLTVRPVLVPVGKGHRPLGLFKAVDPETFQSPVSSHWASRNFSKLPSMHSHHFVTLQLPSR